MELTGHTIFIPGATSGIGLALALRLQERGSTVIIGGRRTERLAELAAQHPGLGTVALDVTDTRSIESAARTVRAEHPDLDTLIAMAGIMRAEDWTTSEGLLETAEATVTTNVLGPIRLISAFLDHFVSRGDATIMTVSSGLAFTPLAATPTYNATKAAIHMLSESIRLQLAGTDVRVLELEPPAVRTDLMPGHAENEMAMPLDAFADEVMEILAAGDASSLREIQVEAVKVLRYAEVRGDYPQVVEMLNARDPHGKP
ncbi:SDR family oxidoreductase [Brachybacterium sp. ACRRE]|uniref:SDR family oxidoreductase n=1 Tax=Brachybacterium sp. ACRRE TaxID=2918184 RepID=UPI001EF23E2C|nr:SDR family NAD(P)-dependent oxidoreductase [Brachybacterium sp. ACRRE]MCG7308514.1 SDR family NAD(P)-dependent oxidoreductase [Brachybacterium sp. ACRRE]